MFIKLLPDGKLTAINAETMEELKAMFDKEIADNITEVEKSKESAQAAFDAISLEGDNDTITNRKAKADAEFNILKNQQMIDKLKSYVPFVSEKIYELELKEING